MERSLPATTSPQPMDPQVGKIYFCDKGDAADTVSRRDLAPEKLRAIRQLHKLDRRWNSVIALHFGIWLTAAWLASRTENTFLNLVCYAIAGLSLSTLSVLGHESSHNLLTRKPAIDRWLGFLCSLPVLFSAAGYRIMHPMHHKHLHTPQDPDDIENVGKNPALLRIVYVFVFVCGVYLYLVTVPLGAIRNGTKAERKGVIRECAAMVLIVMLAWVALPSQIMLEGWLLPLLVAAQIANLRGIAEHGMTSGGSEFTDTRTVKTHPILSFMMCNINYHLEHHLYPGVPWYNLPKLHRLLTDEYTRAGSSVYQSYLGFLRDVVKALVSGVVPGRRLIPLHIREQVCL